MTTIVLSCSGVPPGAAEEAARDIAQEFRDHRPWYSDVRCTWDGARLVLFATSEVDQDGLALMDEFSDCLAAYITEAFDGHLRMESLSSPPGA